MRESLARVLALATGMVVVGAVFLFAAAQRPDPSGEAAVEGVLLERERPDTLEELIALGRATYEEQRCAACHSIAGEGSPRYPLDGVGSRLTHEEIRLWIVDPQEISPGVRKPAFDDLEPEALRGLIAFMESLEGRDD